MPDVVVLVDSVPYAYGTGAEGTVDEDVLVDSVWYAYGTGAEGTVDEVLVDELLLDSSP